MTRNREKSLRKCDISRTSGRPGPVEAHVSPLSHVNVFFHGFLHVTTRPSRAGARKGLIDNVSRTASLKLVEPGREERAVECYTFREQ